MIGKQTIYGIRSVKSTPIHNEKVAQYLNLDKVMQKCSAFRPLVNLVTLESGNYPKNLTF
jgi:hypothetical protein